MSAPDAMSESLNYPMQKRRAVASRSYRVKLNPTNGQNFVDGNTINFTLPSNLAGSYVNWSTAYLKMTVSGDQDYTLEKCGAVSMIDRVQSMTAGSQICDINSWGLLMSILMDGDSSPAYKAGVGNVLLGTLGGMQRGEEVTSGDSRTYCIPFTLTPWGMSQPHRLCPLFSSAGIEFKISLASAAKAVVASVEPNLTFSNVELVFVVTELSPGAQAQVDQLCGGVYNILAGSYQNVATTMNATNTVVTANLGISVSSLERIIVCHRPTASVNTVTKFSIGNRTKNYLEQYSFFINSEQFPARPVLVEDKGAEALAEYLLSDHSLVNFDKQSSFNIAVNGNATLTSNGLDGNSAQLAPLEPYSNDAPTGISAGALNVPSTIGSFITAVELESLSQGRSDRIYSGVSTISSVVTYRGQYGSSSAEAQIDFFSQNTILLSLNTRGTNVWAVSV